MDISLRMGLGSIATMGGGGGLPAWLATIKAGTDSSTSGVVFIVGDSTTVGSKAGDAGDNLDALKNSWPVVMRGLAVDSGFNCRADAWLGASYGYATTADVTAYRPELTLGTWTIDARNAFSSRVIRDNAGTSTLTLTPVQEFDALEVWNVLEAVSSTAQFTVKVDGVTEATISSSSSATPPGLGGSPRQNKTTITGLTKQVQAIDLNRVASDNRPSALIPYNTDESELILASVAASGMTTTAANTTQQAAVTKDYSMGFSGVYFPRDRTIIDLGINDMLGAVDPTTTFRTNLATLRANHIAASPILWVVPHYIAPGSVATLTQEAYHTEILSIASTNGDDVLDLRDRFGSYDTMVTAGDIDADGIHINKQGHAKVAAWIWAALNAG